MLSVRIRSRLSQHITMISMYKFELQRVFVSYCRHVKNLQVVITLSVVLLQLVNFSMKMTKHICSILMEKVAGVLMAACCIALIFVRLTQVNLICDKTIENKAEVVAYGDSFERFLIYVSKSLAIMEQLTQLSVIFQDFDIKHKCACPGACSGGGRGGVEAGIVGIVFMLL